MDRRRRAGHDRDIVRVGEGRHGGIGPTDIPIAAERADRRKDTVRNPTFEIFGVAPVDANHHGRTLWLAVATAVQLDQVRHLLFSAPTIARNALERTAVKLVSWGSELSGMIWQGDWQDDLERESRPRHGRRK